VSRNAEVLTTMATAALALVAVPVLLFRGIVALPALPPLLANVGGAAVVAAVAVLVVVRVADEGGPTGLARDRNAAVADGTVRAGDESVRDPVGGEACVGYLYLVEHRASDADARGPRDGYETLVAGLFAPAPVVVETADGDVTLPTGDAVTPSFASPSVAAPADLRPDVVGDPDPYLRRLGLGEVTASSSHSFLARERDRLRLAVEPLVAGGAVTLVGTGSGGRVAPETVVRAQSADEWAAEAARGLRLARRAALVAGPVGAVLVVAGLALPLV
jgi:hypothetical protein